MMRRLKLAKHIYVLGFSVLAVLLSVPVFAVTTAANHGASIAVRPAWSRALLSQYAKAKDLTEFVACPKSSKNVYCLFDTEQMAKAIETKPTLEVLSDAMIRLTSTKRAAVSIEIMPGPGHFRVNGHEIDVDQSTPPEVLKTKLIAAFPHGRATVFNLLLPMTFAQESVEEKFDPMWFGALRASLALIGKATSEQRCQAYAEFATVCAKKLAVVLAEVRRLKTAVPQTAAGSRKPLADQSTPELTATAQADKSLATISMALATIKIAKNDNGIQLDDGFKPKVFTCDFTNKVEEVSIETCRSKIAMVGNEAGLDPIKLFEQAGLSQQAVTDRRFNDGFNSGPKRRE